MKNTAHKNIDKASVVSMYNNGMSVNDIADAVKCSVATVYYHLQKCTKRAKGGRVSGGIPKTELCKDILPDNTEIEAIAEKNAQNACVVMKKCVVELSGSCGSYEINTGDKCVWIVPNGCDGDGVEVKWDAESPVSFKPDGRTLHDVERRFLLEDQGYISPDDRFRWSYLEEQQIDVFAAIRRANDERRFD